MTSRNPIVRNAIVAMNKPYDMPMGTEAKDKVAVRIEEFTHQYGKREMPRPLYTTFDKLSSYLARWGLESLDAKIKSSLRRNGEFRLKIPVKLEAVFNT